MLTKMCRKAICYILGTTMLRQDSFFLRWQSFLDEVLFKGRKVAFRRFTEAVLHTPRFMTMVKFAPQGTPSSWVSRAKLCPMKRMQT